MKLIFVQKTAASRTLEIGRWSWAALSVICIGLPLGLMAMGYELGQRQGTSSAQEARLSDAEITASRRAGELAQLSADARRKLEAMTRRLAELQVRVTRLDALGTHLTALAGLEGGEFNFAVEPALGGPMLPLQSQPQDSLPGPLEGSFDLMSATLSDREIQLEILAGLLFDAEAQAEAIPAGRPVLAGWLSSRYGNRTDPFTGKRAWHQGIDFAGSEGDDIVAVASGVVSWSGERTGYGTLVEIAHGDGLITRYGHNRENRVEVGDLVRQGDVIALMGNSGRSTGPHVHFEIFKHGRAVDPSSYVRRTLR
ncbi:MAG: peptidoglycan DD-metalloendopeptidase family protein [Luminiphilus sp.]|nr:peptidoglycan DD-metalloendopeptidase family protein [Luminiphilus sp.]